MRCDGALRMRICNGTTYGYGRAVLRLASCFLRRMRILAVVLASHSAADHCTQHGYRQDLVKFDVRVSTNQSRYGLRGLNPCPLLVARASKVCAYWRNSKLWILQLNHHLSAAW